MLWEYVRIYNLIFAVHKTWKLCHIREFIVTSMTTLEHTLITFSVYSTNLSQYVAVTMIISWYR